MDDEERKELERAVGQSEKRMEQVREVEEREASAGTKEVQKKE